MGQEAGFVWIGLKDPTDAEFSAVNEELSLHALAVEDAVKGGQRVKVERFHDTVFAALRTLRYVEATSHLLAGEVMVFVGDRYVVTVRRGEAMPLDGVRHRLESDPETLVSHGPMGVLHAVMDEIVDAYRLIDAEIQRDLEQIEEAVFSPSKSVDAEAIYRLKREVVAFRHAAEPLLSPLGWLHAEGGPVSAAELRLGFRDVGDHVTQVVAHLAAYDRLLSDVLSTYLARVGVQQNNDVRKISARVAIAAVPTMVAGIYGMNFEYIPELGWVLGYPLVMAGMATACGLLYRAFRRSGWL